MAFGDLSHWQIHDDEGRRKYVSSDERERFLRDADTLKASTRALHYVLAYSGCRISEALALMRHHLDAEESRLVICTLKRRRKVFRIVPIPETLTAMLLTLPKRDDGRFWCVHRSNAWRLLKKAMDRAEIVGPMANCKGLRHGFGIRAAGSNVPPNLIQRWMGHASPATTAIYLDAVGNEEREFATRMW